MEDLYLILTPREAKILEHSRLAENRDFLEREDRSCPAVVWGSLTSGQEYVGSAVIQIFMRMSPATNARKIAMSVR